jgi:3-phenylpropionate/cinnamic acid dioxygenase small subunit
MSRPTVSREVRADVEEVLVRYASGIDRRDWELFRTVFTDDVQAEYQDIGTWSGVDELTEWMAATHAPMGHTMHRITNVAVTPGADDDHVSSRAYVHLVAMFDSGGMSAYGLYDDELVRTADGWKVSRRTYTHVHLEGFSA